MFLIEGLDDQPVTVMRFVGGPRADESESGDGSIECIAGEGGAYWRSVRCADDAELRYVWRAGPEPGQHRRPEILTEV